MNTRKYASNNSNWILCRSKKNCPGKIYYFNLLTGEAVWKINEEEKTKENHLNAEKLNIIYHDYPEPSSSDHQDLDETPTNIGSNTSTSNKSPVQAYQNRNFVQCPPMFGQPATFPRGPEQFMPITNIMWMPIPTPNWPCFERRPMLDKITQTQKDRQILVEASKTPLCQRFVNYRTHSGDNSSRSTFYSSTPIKSFNVRSINSVDTILEQRNPEAEIADSNMRTLDSSDLRFLLVAKRRKLLEELNNPVEKKKTKIQDPLLTPKKRVTFNLDNLNDEPDVDSDESDIFTDSRVMIKSGSYTPISPPKLTSNYNNSMANKQEYWATRDSSMPAYNMSNLSENNIENNSIPPNMANDKILENDADMPIDSHDKHFKMNKYQYVVNNNLLNENDMANSKNMANDKILENATDMPIDSDNEHSKINKNPYVVNDNLLNENVMANGKNMPNRNAESNDDMIKMNNVWYIVCDMDVLLDDFMFVDMLLQADEKYTLLIPHLLRAAIEALCIGDCRGQQRVLVARQLSRKMATTHKQFKVEPPSAEDSAANTTDGILNCCQRAVKNNCYIILVTNDPHLTTKAKSLNINCYTPDEIKSGTLTNRELFNTKLQKIKITVGNNDDDNNNSSYLKTTDKKSFWPVNTFKKQLFVNDEKTNKNCDILINITKPNSIINRNIDRSEIKNDEKKSNFELTKNIEITEDLENIKFSNQNSQIQNISNSKSVQCNKEFNCIPELNNQSEAHNLNVINDNKITTGPEVKHRIKRIMNLITPQIKNPDDDFKIPALHPSKKASTPLESYRANDNVRSNFKNTAMRLEERLNTFCVRSKAMHDKIKTRLDEWTCTYTQIMEELLNSISQNDSEQIKRTSYVYKNLQESLACIKMYDNEELRDVVKVLTEMLAKCTCNKGKLKLDITPNDFMKLLGCGIVMVHILKNILPTREELIEYESSLEILLKNIECEQSDFDPELLKPTTVCRSEVNQDNKTRFNFTKPASEIINYLKKHFKEWSSYDEEIQAEKTSLNYNKFEVVRFFGKNTNMIKIDSNKSLSFAKTVTDQENDGLPSQYKTPNLNLQEEYIETYNSKSNPTLMTKKINESCKNNEKAEPEMIRNEQKIDEENNKEPLNLDALNYSEINIDIDDVTTEKLSNYFDEKTKDSNQNVAPRKNDRNKNDNIILEGIHSESNYVHIVKNTVVQTRNNCAIFNSDNDENYANDEWNCTENNANNHNCAKNNKNHATNNDNYADNHYQKDESNDSGIENDSTQAYTVIKIFLNELSTTYKIIYEFVVSFVEELRGEEMSQDRKNILHIKSSRCLQNLIAIIRQLRSIIKRESLEDTVLKSLLITAGVEATSDKRITRYRQIVLKCLEQAQILENALKVIACITIEDLDAISNNADSISSSIRYLNVFE